MKEAVITAFELPQLGLASVREAITGHENAKADYLFEINENCLLLSYERNTKVTALLLNPIDGTVLAEQQFSIPTNAAGTYRILQLSDQLWLYAPRSARGEEQLFIPFLCTETGFAEYCGYGLLDPMNAQVQRIPFGGTNLMISGKRVLVGNTTDFIRLGGGYSADTIQPEVIRELHQIHIINETGDPIVMAQPAVNYRLNLDEGYQTQQVAVPVFGGFSHEMGYAFTFFDTNTKEWQKEILKLPEIYPVTRNFMADSDRGIYVGTISATGKKIYILGNHYDETLKKYTGYPLLITAQFP